MASSHIFACRWDWCRSSFPTLDDLQNHVKHEHIWPMNPMRKTEIALMRKLDLASLHSSQNTDSSIISRGLLDSLKTPPPTPPIEPTSPENESFNTFSQLSSPPQTHSPQSLPVSPAFESLLKQYGPSRLSAALEIFERNHGHKSNQRVRSPSHQRSPTRCPPTPPSHCSRSSQEAVEQQLTQEDDVLSQPLFPSNLQTDHELDVELVWPPLAEDDIDIARAEIPNARQPTPDQNFRLGSSPSPSRGQGFRCGSLNVSLDSSSSQPCADSQESNTSSQPFVLQTQAPYSSQAMVWSQSQ